MRDESALTVGAWIRRATRDLGEAKLSFGHGARNATVEARWIVASALKMEFSAIDSRLDDVPPSKVSTKIRHYLRKRIQSREPLAYLLGEAYLAGHRFKVDKRVIVPRSFIAEVIGEGLRPWYVGGKSRPRILDMCTGSGCLAILCAYAYPKSSIDAADTSRLALQVARANLKLHHCGARVQLFKSDLFSSLPARKYDLILCNPPYVRSSAMRSLPQEYRAEPKLALWGGRDGLDLVEKILQQAKQFMSPKGILVLEIGRNQRAFEKRFPSLPAIWLETESQHGCLVLIRAIDMYDLP